MYYRSAKWIVWVILSQYLPMMFFSGTGGMMRPIRKYLPTSRSCRPKKSLNLRSVLNCFTLNFGMLVCVETLFVTTEREKKIGCCDYAFFGWSIYIRKWWNVTHTCTLNRSPCLRQLSAAPIPLFQWSSRHVRESPRLPSRLTVAAAAGNGDSNNIADMNDVK